MSDDLRLDEPGDVADYRVTVLAWLARAGYGEGVYLNDIERHAYNALQYPEYCQFQEWEGEYETIGDLVGNYAETFERLGGKLPAEQTAQEGGQA